jgi:hypothetical protein
LADKEHKDLTANQIYVLGLLMSGISVENAAAAAGINRKTVWRWRKEPAFRDALREAGDELWQDTLAILKGMSESALTAISSYYDQAEDGTLDKAQFALRYLREINRLRAADEVIREERRLNDEILNLEQGAGANGNGHRRFVNFWERDD